jgi:hypothetical protein
MLNSAKKFAMKNKEKIAAGVDKATDAKVDNAAAKFGGKPKQPAAAAEAPAVPPAPATATPVDDAAKPAAEADPA